MTRSVALGVAVLGSFAMLVGCDSSEGDAGSGGAGGAGTGGATATTATATATGQGGMGGAGGEGGAGSADECPEVNATEPCGANGMRGCQVDPEGSGRLVWTACDETSGAASTPLVLSFDGEEAEFTAGASAVFDLTGLAQSRATDWPTAKTPWLALDRDDDGTIGDGTELFGSAVTLRSGRLAQHGFEALAELDDNGDGRIDARDPAFATLTLWSDADGDRGSARSELSTLEARGVESISLAYESAPVCDLRGNCSIERASFTWRAPDGSRREGRVIDLHLAFQSR
jgi:hypothetical protein